MVTRNENLKRMVINSSQTINRFTRLDAFPLFRIDDTVNAIAQFSFLAQSIYPVHTIRLVLRKPTKPRRPFKLVINCISSCVYRLE